MKYYTDCISLPLAEKLKEKGMPVHIWRDMFDDSKGTDVTFGACLDWLMSEKDYTIAVNPMQCRGVRYMARIYYHGAISCCFEGDTWHEAAEKAIEKALELIQEEKI